MPRYLLIALGLVVLGLGLPARSHAQATQLRCGAGLHNAQTGWPARAYQVVVGDSTGALVSNYTGNVTATVAQSPSGGTLGGTVTVQAASTNLGAGIGTVSVATFTNLILTGQGDWRLTFAAAGLTGCTTAVFSVGASFHLASGSPARGAGLAIPGVITSDFDGVSVPQSGAIDAGALQFRTGTTPPPPTSTVLPAPQNFRLGS